MKIDVPQYKNGKRLDQSNLLMLIFLYVFKK